MNKFKKLIKIIMTDPKELIIYADTKGLLRWLPDRLYLNLMFRIKVGYTLNLSNPQNYNEKLQWLKLYDRNPLYTNLVDKYEVRNYIEKYIGKEYLIPLLGLYKSFDDINFDNLPDQFVLKCTHDSGGVVICRDKSNFDKKAAKEKINKCLKRNYYHLGREFPYKNIEPRIICEKYMVDDTENELRDYKFMCFNGDVKCLFVCLNRGKETGLNVDFYDLEWNPMPFERHYKRSGTIIPKPKNFDKMVEFAEKLSKDIPFLRVDFYEVNGQLYFGELTFYPGNGFEEFTPVSYDAILGSWMRLPNKD